MFQLMLTVKKQWSVKCLKSDRHELLICCTPKLYNTEVCSQNTHTLYLLSAEHSHTHFHLHVLLLG